MRFKAIGCALLLSPLSLHAQATGRITGLVTSDSGQPMPRVQISVVGTPLRAYTASTGRYTISNVPAGQQMVQAASLGSAPQKLAVTVVAGSPVVADFSLTTIAFSLKGIVVTGYGTQRRDEITGAVASVKSDEFVQGPARSAASLLAGKVPGLAVSTPNGDPRSGPVISLRGATTIQGSTNPLVLVDGVPGGLNTVATQDIESISVLKDGSAAAVYGSRASNGVILITTKRHEGGKPTLRYDGYTSYQTIYNRPDFLTAADYRRLRGQRQAFVDLGYTNANWEDLGFTTDWEREVLRGSPVSLRHNLTLSGGAPTTNYTASLNYEDAQGIFLRSNNQDVTGRANIRHSMFSGRLDADVNLVSRTQTFFDGPDFNYAWRQTLIRNPTDRVQTDDGLWQERGTYFYTNPLGLIDEQNGQRENRNSRLHGRVTFRPIDHLSLSLMGGTSRQSDLWGSATTFRHEATTQRNLNGQAWRGTSSNLDRILEATGTYARNFGDHNFTLLGGYGYQDFLAEGFDTYNFQFPTDLFGFDQLNSGSALTDGKAALGSYKNNYKLIGFFSRLNYDWQDRFMLMASVRYEGNSRFGAAHKWGWFPAVSAGWRLTKERFMSAFPFVNDLRLRAGRGVTGIAPRDSYLSLTSYSYSVGGQIRRFLYNGQWVQGLAPSRNPNPDLRWEQKDETNVGLDFAMYDSRLSGTVDVYSRNTRDMLYNFSVPVPPYLFSSILANVGKMSNSGIEAQLSYEVFRGNRLRWTTSVNGSTNTNKLVSLSSAAFRPQTDYFYTGATGEPIQQSTHRVDIGGPIGNFYGFKSVGIDSTGAWIVLDSAGKEISIRNVKEKDRRVLGNGVPKRYAAWNNNIRFGRFDLDVNMRGAFGFQVLNFQRLFYENPKNTQYNMLRSAFDPVYGKRPVNYDLAYVSYYIENGDYWKLDNATVGYTFGQSVLRKLSGVVANARVYFSGRNLLTFTRYKGMDPEVDTNGLAPGVENRDTYPTTRLFTAGMTISF